MYFCKIIRGDFGTEFVYETENTVVFNDINPKAPVHICLYVRKEHIASLNELEDPKLMAELLQTVKDVTKKSWIKIIQNTNQHRKRSRSRSFPSSYSCYGKNLRNKYFK